MAHIINANPSTGYMRFNLEDLKNYTPGDVEINMPGAVVVFIRTTAIGCSARVRKRSDRSILATLTPIDAGATELEAAAAGITIEIEGYTTGEVEVETTDGSAPIELA